MAFLFILSSGAGGYITAENQHEARDRVSYIDGAGWLFECELGTIQKREHRQRRPVTIQLVSTLGQPDANAMADALERAGHRLCAHFTIPPQRA